MAAPSSSTHKARPMQERFDAAVKVIRSLPNEGPFQPSNTTKLRFYALYKQVSQGPCNIPKPAFWDAVGRAKWEGWSVCGEMSKEVAMQMYVEELQRLVETMPHSTEVEQFLQAIGPFYEEVATETTVEDEGEPLKPTNQIADEEGEISDSDESVDFKDSFQELSSEQPATSPTPSSISHSNRPPRTVTFADHPHTSQSSSGQSIGSIYPQTLESVTMEMTQLQTNVQSMLGQLNTLAQTVSSLSGTSLSGTLGTTSSGVERGTLVTRSHPLVPRLVTRTGRFLTLLMKAGPLLAIWPVVVSVVMAIIKRSLSPDSVGVSGWVWFVLTALQGLFTLLLVRKLQL